MAQIPTFNFFRTEEDPTYEEVNEFYQTAFDPIRKREPLPPQTYYEARDQIIQGWVFLTWKILEARTKYDNYDKYFKDKRIAAMFIKGHNLQKVIYCLWKSEIVFFCPETFGKNDKTIEDDYKEKRLDPESYVANRFYAKKEFYYSDDFTKSWKSLTFDKFSRMDENLFIAGTSSPGHEIQSLRTTLFV